MLTVPVHELATTEQYLPVLDGHPTVAPAGERFAYNNAGYVVLALLAERASGADYHRLVPSLVCEPAGMVDTAFLRSDELPGRAALGYLAVDGLRTNLLHLPVRGSGTAASTRRRPTSAPAGTRCWPAGSSRRRRSPRCCGRTATGPRSPSATAWASTSTSPTDQAWMEGYDAGVSMFCGHQPASATTYTVIANWSQGAWPVMTLLGERLG